MLLAEKDWKVDSTLNFLVWLISHVYKDIASDPILVVTYVICELSLFN